MKSSKTFKLVTKNQHVKITQKSPRIILRQVGRAGRPGGPGQPGAPGAPGQGLPTGGIDGQYLVKDTNEAFKYRWETPDVVDKNYVTNFTTLSTVPVNHNLNKYPSVTVIDSAGDEVEGEVYHVNTSQFIVRFNAAFSGKVICN